MENIDASQQTLHECHVLCARAWFHRPNGGPKGWDQQWYQTLWMWVDSSELSVHHCFSSLFHFLIPSQAEAQSPREISHPAQCDEGNACVCVCVHARVFLCAWKQDESKRQGEREKLFSILGLRIPLCSWKVNLGWKKGNRTCRKSTRSVWDWSECSINSD